MMTMKFWVAGMEELPLTHQLAAWSRVQDKVRSMYGPVHDHQVYRVDYTHQGRNYVAEVGQTDTRVTSMVMAIYFLTSRSFVVCSANTGFLTGDPWPVIGPEEAREVELFDDSPAQFQNPYEFMTP
jgi:hypothetical protein